MKSILHLLCICALALFAHGRTIDFEADVGATAEDDSLQVAQKNGGILNSTLASLQPGDVLVVPNKTFAVMGGIHAIGLNSVTIQIEGTLEFSDDIKHWPRTSERVAECIQLDEPHNVTFTASGKGTLNGKGNKWWGIPGIGYLIRKEDRPRLMKINNGTDILVENLLFKDSPYWTFSASNVSGLEIRHSDIDVRRMHDDGHNLIDITAFNTDGFDVGGKNIWIHDCNVWNQDDSVCVKGNTTNMLVERVNASGFGLTIGSVGGGTTIRNITFRDCYMHKTIKGIYMKFNSHEGSHAWDHTALVADVLYENIVIDEPSQYGIWIGPAQQSDSREFWHGHPCSIFWPKFANCDAPAFGTYANITLRNITINNPKGSPGLIYANKTNPMQNVVFDNVRVNNPGKQPFGKTYFCENVQGIATGNTWPVPDCFEDRTSKAMFMV